jgi:superfamily II DNA or RNA helicase
MTISESYLTQQIPSEQGKNKDKKRLEMLVELSLLRKFKANFGIIELQRKVSSNEDTRAELIRLRDSEGLEQTIIQDLEKAYMANAFLPPNFEPRPSQQRLIDELPCAIKKMQIGNEYIIQKDTGTGKTAMFTMIMQLVSSNKQIAIVVPTITLGVQTLHAIKRMYPDEKISYQFTNQNTNCLPESTNKSNDGRVIVFVKDSFVNQINNNESFKPNMVILDESHLCNTPNFKQAFDKIRNKCLTIDFSATPYNTYIKKRGNSDVPVWAGRSRHWTHKDNLNPDGTWKGLIFRDDKKQLLNDQESCPIEAIAVTSDLNFEDQVKMNSNGEYDQDSITEFQKKNWNQICNEFINCYQMYSELRSRKKIMVACPANIDKTVEAAQKFALQTGEVTATITSGKYVIFININGEIKEFESTKDDVLKKFKNGEIKFLFSINQLKEGFDCPAIDCIMMMNFTKSVTSYIQILGRGTRKDDSKEDTIIVDYLPNKFSKINPLVASVALGEYVKLIKQPQKTRESNSDSTEEEESVINGNYFNTIKDLFVSIQDVPNIIRKEICETTSRNIDLSNEEIFQFVDQQIKSQYSNGVSLETLITNESMSIKIENQEYLNNSYINQLDVYVNIPRVIIQSKKNLINRSPKLDEDVTNSECAKSLDQWQQILQILKEGKRPCYKSQKVLHKMFSRFISEGKYPKIRELNIGRSIQEEYQKIVETEKKTDLIEWSPIVQMLKNGQLPINKNQKDKLYNLLAGRTYKIFAQTELGKEIVVLHQIILEQKEAKELKDWNIILELLQKDNLPNAKTHKSLHTKLSSLVENKQIYSDFAQTELGEKIKNLYNQIVLKNQEEEMAEWISILDLLKKQKLPNYQRQETLYNRLNNFVKGRNYTEMRDNPICVDILELYEAMNKSTFRSDQSK